MKFIWISFIAAVAFAETITVLDRPDSKMMYLWSFRSLFYLLQENLPNLSATANMGMIQFLDIKLKDVAYVGTTPLNYRGDLNKIIFSDPGKVFTLNMPFYWIYSILIFPISGKANASISISNVLYEWTFDKHQDRVSPLLKQMKWTIDKIEVSNSGIANFFGVPSLLSKVLESLLNSAVVNFINTALIKRVDQYLSIRYPNEFNIMISYYKLSNNIFSTYKLKTSEVTLSYIKLIYSDDTQSYSGDEVACTDIHSSEATNYKKYLLPKSIVLNALNKVFTSFCHNFVLTANLVPSQSIFRLNSRQFAQVIPDFYMNQGDTNISITANVTSSNFVYTYKNKNKVEISGLTVCLTFMHNRDKLLQVTTAITGLFSAFFEIVDGEFSGLVNLKIESLTSKAINFVLFKYELAYTERFNDYLNSALENWITPVFDRKVLGNGIYLEANDILNISESTAMMTQRGIEVKAVSYTH